ncbi:hypothetical protein COM04_23015 [Bacillus wiedmannii]|uniref:Uncharacterized protein n=1 Tax=Bacillus wiedmannii TaxID=1890302 RepID=A0ABD6TFT8_9BACI|nr:hypothetical protein [Bacillus wiedmannii]KAA0792444.1 hypothetical protein DN394_06095 [Bacillus sp. BB081]MED3396260.1 hypothetical protein [Bacillus wiedmannii]PEO57086.1 hypothetical protein CN560_16655 [Bacillus wiedmannii]PEO69630.1 hypothetical protein CN572_23900 [Bacillus wiedmannii]PEP73920.1 hypothetical protein CN573_15025 [Bacillus wiedmannii]
MSCIVTGLTQPLCLTLVYNVSSGILISSTVDCGSCALATEFDYTSKNLVIRVPFTGEGTLIFNDKFQASCVTTNLTQP